MKNFSIVLLLCLMSSVLCGQRKTDINKMLDQWHDAATRADSAAYFGLMHHDAVFVGTDSTEVWTKNEFLAFAAPYFAKGKAWSFKATSRNIYESLRSRDYVWFDEMLTTWMGPCRGSGVVVLTPEGWKVQHYVLSVTVPNDKMNKFQEAMKSKE